ncbi:MAG: condensation domain-containing protein [Dehalococcoidia bacterium]
MQRKTEGSVRSIPLNCVDKSLLALDSANEPMLFRLILNLGGEIDSGRLSQAILSAQQAHPVMRTILHSRNWRLSREIQEDSQKAVLSVAGQAELQNTSYDDYLSSWMNQPLNIREEFPVRVLLVKKDARESSVVFTFHHSVADALRALIFVRKVIQSYNGEGCGDSKSPGGIYINRKGDELLELAHNWRSKVGHYYERMISSLFYRFVVAAFLLPTRVFHDKRGQWEGIHFRSENITSSEFEKIQSKSKSVGVTLNDIFLAACFRTVEKWNRLHGKGSKRIRIMVPVDIAPKTSEEKISNQVSFVSLSTRPEDRTEPAELLRRVSRNMAHMRKNGTAFAMVYFLYFCSRFPLPVMKAIARFFMITRTYVDTTVVSNLGVIWPAASGVARGESRMGGAEIIAVECIVPAVRTMGMSICVNTYNENLNVCLAYRTSSFSDEKAQEFLDLYVEEIKGYQVGGKAA